MTRYLIRRLLLTIPVVFGVTFIIFAMVRLIPGDPAQVIAGEQATQEIVDAVRRSLGLDQPIIVQYGRFLGDLALGDMGRSTRSQRPVVLELADRFPNTIELTLAGMLVASVIGIGAGVVSATRRNRWPDTVSMLLALTGVSMPVFWLGLMLILVFSVTLGWLPPVGRGTWAQLILPAFTLGAASAAILARMTRSSLLEVLGQDFVTTARAKGLAERFVVYKHALKNAMIPVVTVMGLQFGTLLSGAVLTETVFAWPGIGRLIVESILARDYPVVQGAVLLTALSFVLVNLVVDLLYSVLDPRIRFE
ncbi:MAG: nickel ABC transporter permease [Candidatus Rokuibacteriota bacterium]